MSRRSFLQGIAGVAVAGFIGSKQTNLLRAQESVHVPVRSTRIRSVEILPLSIPLKLAIKLALKTPQLADNILVRLRTEDGVTGLGEASPYSAVTGETQATDVAMAVPLAQIVKGRDPFMLAGIDEDMEAVAPNSSSIRAAFEMALWDICGKISGQPVCSLLGQYRKQFETDVTIFLDTPAAMAEAAHEQVKRGFKAIKIKVGDSPVKDVDRLVMIREALGADIHLRIDANQGWTPAEAVKVLHAVKKCDIELCEQPVASWDWEGMAFVRSHADLPIMADESVHTSNDLLAGIRAEAIDLVNIKLMKTGGILSAVKIAHVAEAANLRAMLGCMAETRLGLTAAAHVVASQPCVHYADLDAFLVESFDPIIDGMQVTGGVVRLPDAPGLGVDLDPALAKGFKAI
jgi:L-Ala-D/L-Glu epimerase